jgi:MFS family permease
LSRAALRVPRGVLLAVLSVRLFDESNAFMLPGTFEPLRTDIELTYAQTSSAFLAIAVGAIAGSAASVAADYRSRRAIASAGALGFAVSLVVIGTAASYTALLVGSFAVGIASTAMVDASEIALADLAGDDLERHLTTQNVLGSIGDLLGPVIVIAVLAAGLSWRWCFFLSAGLTAAYGFWLAVLRFPPPHPREEGHTVRAGLAAVVTDPAVWLAGGVGIFMSPLDEPLLAFLIAHLERAQGLSEAGATAIATLSIIGAFVGYATLRRRRGVVSVDAVCLAVSTTALVVAPEAVTASLAALAVGVFLVRMWVDFQARVLTMRVGQTGTVKATLTVIETVGFLLPVAAGAVADAIDVSAGLATYAVIAWALALLATLFARATARRRQNPELAMDT